METSTFVPKLPNKPDRMGHLLRKISQVFLITGIISVPLFFIPSQATVAMFPKVFLLIFCCLIAGFFYSLHVLRTGTLTLRPSLVVLSFWLIVVVSAISALLSPNLRSAFFGDALEIHTVGFLALLGLVMTLTMMLGTSKRAVLAVYGSVVASMSIAALMLLARIMFGPEFLTLGVLQSVTDTLVGSFNDLGILSGLIVLVSLVALAQLELPKKGLAAVGGVLVLAMAVLISVNFFFLWVLIGAFSLLVLMYLLTQDRFGMPHDAIVHPRAMLVTQSVIVGCVCVVSALFLVAGSSVGAWWSNTTGINYIEIRPSFSATFDVMRQTYAENALIGSGPNRFAEVWNLYKDTEINNTIFWNTTFSAGAGYIPTWFITSGVLGAAAWLLFLGLFLVRGVRMLLVTNATDTFWYFIGTVSFVASVYIWILSFAYVPGPTILILGAVTTGIMVLAGYQLSPSGTKKFNFLSSSRTGFVLIAAVMAFIIMSVIVGYAAVTQFNAAYKFSTVLDGITTNDAAAIALVTSRVANAYQLHPTDLYARTLANYQLTNVTNLFSIENPTPEQEQQFQSSIANALSASTQAIAQRPTDARNWQVLGDIYASLSVLRIEGSKERAFESYAKAEELDPSNPYYVLQKAYMESRDSNNDEARRLAMLSLQLKPNYTDALYFLTQLDISAGDIDSALRTTEAMVTLEPNNPGRYYQLGVLYSAVANADAAIGAFGEAIRLNPSYANARYFRAQQFVIKGDTAAALADLEVVRELNPDNSAVTQFIDGVKNGTITNATATAPTTITDGDQATTQNEVTTTNEVPDSTVVSPVNTPSARSEGAQTAPATENQP
jgi:tetratricopeptide (TPR) repeat protein